MPPVQSPTQSPTQSMISATTFPQSPEALDAVLGRFQKWTSSRKSGGEQCVRELSYEEAVKSNRRRFQAAKTRPSNGKLQGEPGVIPVDAPSVAPISRKDSSSRRPKKAAPAAVKTHPVTPEKLTASRARKPQPPKSQQEFRRVLAETIASGPGTPALKTAALTHVRRHEADRQVSLSLRLAPAEQAMIRARASAAGISTSAYLRQCALEVEQLREQMRQTLGLIGQGAAMAVSNSQIAVQAAPPGFLERLKRVFFGEKQARNLSLRA